MAYEFYYAIALMIILLVNLFRYTAVGRRVLSVGKNREVARLSGVRVNRFASGPFVVGGSLRPWRARLHGSPAERRSSVRS